MLRTVVATLVVLAAVVGVGYLVLDRLAVVGERLGRLDTRMEQVAETADRAISAANEAGDRAATALDRAGAAEDRALDAEANAAEAARTRDRAEESRRLAEEARLNAEAATVEAEETARLAAEEAAAARRDLEQLAQERQAELDRLQEALGALVETRRTALGLVMSLGSDAIEFGFDRADLGSADRELLSRIAGILLTSRGFSVAVYGHTDDVGTAAYNQGLSERRARSVRDYLVEAGVDPDIISTVGYGQSSPRVEGTTPEARAKNRRVEIAIIDVNLGPVRTIEGQ